MDRIFLNVKSGKTFVSAKDGLLRDNDVWKQVGTINLEEILKTKTPSQRKAFVGRIEVS